MKNRKTRTDYGRQRKKRKKRKKSRFCEKRCVNGSRKHKRKYGGMGKKKYAKEIESTSKRRKNERKNAKVVHGKIIIEAKEIKME